MAAWVGVAIALVGAGLSAYSASQAASAQAEAASYNRKVALNQAEAAKNAAAIEQSLRAEKYRRALASQRALIGASGISPGEGSPLLVQMDAAEQAALDLARVAYRGRIGSMNYQAEAQLQSFVGRQAIRAGNLKAGASLLSGVGSAATAYSRKGGGTNAAYDYTQDINP